jgi:glycosyltransferase involved in cell wall biosynthesis
MKIVFLTRHFYPSIGGVQKHVLELSKEAIKDKNSISIITESYSNNLKDIENSGKIKIYRIPIKSKKERIKKFEIWSWLIKNKDLLKSTDIVHAHDIGFWILPIKVMFPKKKIYMTFHGYEPKSYFKKKNTIEKKIAESLSNGSIAVGEYLKKYYKISSKEIIYGASNATQYSKKNKKIIYDACFVGRLEADTGIKQYLEAINKIKNKDEKNLKTVICGNGSLSKELEKFVKKNGLLVTFTGWVNNPYKYISESKIVFASQYLSIIEAAQLKKMIFSIYDTKIKRDCLFCLPIKNDISISDNTVNLSNNIKDFIKYSSKYQKRIQKAYDWASKQTWENVYKKYLDLWKRL